MKKVSSVSRAKTLNRLFGSGVRNWLGQAWLEFEVHALPLHHQGTLQHLRMDRADVLADDAHGNQLDGTKKENADHQGRNPNREAIPVEQFIDQITESGQG